MQWALVFSLAFLVRTVGGDIFSSTAHLQNLLDVERSIVMALYDYLDGMEQKLSYVRSYVNEFSQTVGFSDMNGDDKGKDLVTNPLYAFKMVKRLTSDWGTIQRLMQDDDWLRVQRLAYDTGPLLPQDVDLHGAALALVRLQDTYKLNMSDMARGRLLGAQSPIGLTARDCLFLGKQSYTNGYYGHAIEWLEEALSRAHMEGNVTATPEEIIPFLNVAIKVHDGVFETDHPEEYQTLGHPVHQSSGAPKQKKETKQSSVRLGLNITEPEVQRNYESLCRGEKLRPPKDEKNLYCRYTTGYDPYLIIQPVKMEEFSHDPHIVHFHDLMTNEEANIFQQLGLPKLSRSKVQARNGEEISVTRVSQNGWLAPHEHPVAWRINRRVQMVTGLSTDESREHSEMVQIANYGMGGHYVPHYDYMIVDKTPEEINELDPRERKMGDRTATLMFYLTNVRRGGATVFPRVGVGVWPKKGSAVFWYNLKKNGSGNIMTLHGACPVLYGEKWVANYWIRELGQAFHRRCSLNQNE